VGRGIDMNVARRLDSWGGLALCGLLYAYARVRAALTGGPALPPMRATTPPAPGRVPKSPKRILAIKFYGLGNMVMVLPAIQALREAHPAAEIDFLTLVENESVLQRSGLLTRTLGIRVHSFRELFASVWETLRVVRARHYDLVIDFEQFVKLSAIIAYATGAPDRIGFNTDGQRRGWLYTVRVVYTDSEHMTRIFLRVVRPLGITGARESVELATAPDERAHVDAFLAEHRVEPGRFPIIVVHVGSGDNFYRIALKRWSVENFARLATELATRYGAAVVLTGKGPEERALVDATLALGGKGLIDGCDRFSVGELLALLERSHLAVVNDTSVMHLAGAMGTPVAAFFGPTAPLHYGPHNPHDLVFYQDLYCSPCLTNYNLKASRCTDPVCVRTIGVEQVLAAIDARFLGPDAPLRALLETRTQADRLGRAASC
jgi:ADP-heptose:LPS heptosyltransferase